ncbi:hypothetical protein RHMOL_Rhmol11G0250800 [Rhododendron molle]|uniref:Uncharacterized protein n=1 Tax=Rhododendron molle TaxID=49168 RepID=A0ACC0LWD8_RHOML|nr:hypothetical protein RHMOL_Rhmol11G0250800 [Rhododendron molle]
MNIALLASLPLFGVWINSLDVGLEWMLRLKDNTEREPATTLDQLEEPQAEEICPLRQLCCKASLFIQNFAL